MLEHVAFELEDIQSAVDAVSKAGLTLRFKDHNIIHDLLSNFVEGMHGTDVEIMGPEK